jgi:hypothetical protein
MDNVCLLLYASAAFNAQVALSLANLEQSLCARLAYNTPAEKGPQVAGAKHDEVARQERSKSDLKGFSGALMDINSTAGRDQLHSDP